MTRPATSTRPVRDRVIAVVLALVAILVAGGIVQMSRAVKESERTIHLDVALGQRERLTERGSGAFVDVRIGDRLQRDDELASTPGRWVVVDVRTWAHTMKLRSIEVKLLWRGNTYAAVDDDFEPTEPGFTSVRSSVFEVPAEAVGEFALVVGQVEVIQSHMHYLRLTMPRDPGRVAASAGRTVALTPAKVEVAR